MLRLAVVGAEERAAHRGRARPACARPPTEALADGAWGMSTGLVYPPGAYAVTDEIVAVGAGLPRRRRPVRQPHPQRERRPGRRAPRGDRDRPPARRPGRGLPPQGGRADRTTVAPPRRWRSSTRPRRGPARPPRRLSVRGRQHAPDPAPPAVGPRRRERRARRAARIGRGPRPDRRRRRDGPARLAELHRGHRRLGRDPDRGRRRPVAALARGPDRSPGRPPSATSTR